MRPNPTQAPTSRKEEKRQRTDESAAQEPPNPQQSPANGKKRAESEQDPRVRRSNQAGDQDVDDSADMGGDDQGPDGTR